MEKIERNYNITLDKFGLPYVFTMGGDGKMMIAGRTIRQPHSYTALSRKYNLSVPRIQSIVKTYKWIIREAIRNYDGTEFNL